jgi:hypothetical protein
MEVRVVCKDAAHNAESDYVHVRTCTAADDDTVTLATIQRIVDKSNGAEPRSRRWKVKTLVEQLPMSADAAVGLATRYAERKGIPVVYAERD